MDADLRELLRRQWTWLRQDVRRNRQLPNVVQQGGCSHGLDFAGRQPHGVRQRTRECLDATNMRARHLIFGIDRGRESLEGREVQV